MKKIVTVLWVFILLQTPCLSKPKSYQAIITSMDGKKTTGIIKEVRDSGVVIIMDNQVFEYKVKDIKSIRIKCNNCMGKSVLIGSLTGVTLGVIVGSIAGDNGTGLQYMSSSQNAAVYGAVLGVIGGIGGAVVSQSAVTYNINGDQHVFESIRVKMKKYELPTSG